MRDLISREEAAKRLESLADKYDKMGMHYDESCFLFAAKIVRGVPSAVRWIPFDDVKPEDGQSVLAVTTEGEMEVHQYDANWENCLCQYGGNVKTFNITHWMPLPEPPKGE